MMTEVAGRLGTRCTGCDHDDPKVGAGSMSLKGPDRGWGEH